RPMKMIGSHVSAQFSKPLMKVPRRGVSRRCNRLVGAKSLLHILPSGVRSLTSSGLGAFSSVHDHDVSREIVLSSEQGRTGPVGVDGNVPGLETADALGVETARHDDLHPLVPGGVERLANTLDQHLVHAGATEVAHLVPEGP